jgi:hypothetical protein
MADKKDVARFTIQFSTTDPMHLQVIDILNRQGRRSKAPYIVSAVLYYESRAEMSVRKPAAVDADMIEAVVKRLLSEKSAPEPDGIRFDNTLSELGQDGLDAVAGALDAFKRGFA